MSPKGAHQHSNEAFVLTLLGKHLDISWLVNKKKKFRRRCGQEAAMEAMKQLEKDGMELVPKTKAKEQSRFVNLLNQKHLLSLHLRLFPTLDLGVSEDRFPGKSRRKGSIGHKITSKL